MLSYLSVIDPFDLHKRSAAEVTRLYNQQTAAIKQSLHLPSKPVAEPNITKVTFSEAAVQAILAEQAREQKILK